MASQVSAISAKRRRSSKPAVAAPDAPVRQIALSPRGAIALPVVFAALVAGATLLPGFADAPAARWSCWGAAGVLLVWSAALLVAVERRCRALAIEISLRKQHYIQACAHLTLYLYWGAYWPGVREAAPLIAVQLAFAYALDSLLSWSRRDSYTLGFGPFPIIFSTNLFLWFKPEWFYLQFVMVAVGFWAREFLKWERDGRRAHIFNPSSFPLAVFSVALILTHNTNLTWGQEIAKTQLYPPHMYLVIFLVSLPGQVLFGVSSMTIAAVVTTYALIAFDVFVTGMHVFESPTIPIAVFLGMHLLFTDPSTSPRTELGRIVFGVLYGASVFGLYIALERLGVPTFYDKLLPVPILNLMVRAIDRAAKSDLLKRFDPGAIGAGGSLRARYATYTALWAAVFVASQMVTASATTLARADLLLTDGHLDEAIGQYRALTENDPSRFEGHNKLGYVLMRTGRSQEALTSIRKALELEPKNAEAHNNLGLALMQAGRPPEAIESLRRAAELNPQYAEARYNLGHALVAAGQPAEAAAQFRAALQVKPDWTPALASLAWLESTEPQGVRNPDEALRLALRAADLTGRRDAQVLDVLAAAYAAAGRFAEAVATAESAIPLAARSTPELAGQIGERLKMYRAGQAIVAGR
jgi:tetratricopeptide (TPR) repeat protein